MRPHDREHEPSEAALAADPAPEPETAPEAETPLDADEPARPRRRWRRWAIGAAGLVVVAAAALFVTNRTVNGDETAAAAEAESEETEEDEPIPVELATVERGEIAAWITATANLVAEGDVMVVAEAEGRVIRVAAEEGDWVRKGQTLALLDRGDATMQLEKARVREENAASVLARGEELAREALISREELEKRQTDLALARQEHAEARWRLAKTEIRAPISGRLTLRNTQPGQHVAPGNELFRITDADPLIARIYLPEREVLALDAGRPVAMTLDAAPDVAFRGRIRQISPVVDAATGTIKLTVEAIDPPPQVRSGSFVTVRVVRERRPEAVLLPKEAVVRELQQAHVFVAKKAKDGLVAERRDVTLGLEEGGRVQALSGLEPGEELVVAGQGSLEDGQAIRKLGADTSAAVADADGAPAEREG